MKIEQKKYSETKDWEILKENCFDTSSGNFVMAFGSNALLEDVNTYKIIRNNYPNADIILKSTSGEIYDIQVNDGAISLMAVCFESTKIKTAIVQIDEAENSLEAGRV